MATLQLHPLMIELILDKVFLYLDLKALKTCRQVCSKWEEISREEFSAKGTVSISTEKPSQRNLENFEKLKEKFHTETESITCWHPKFNFAGKFLKDDLNAFFKSRENILKGVKFQNLSTVSINNQPENWKWKWNAVNLNHFEFRNGSTGITVSLSNFRTTKTIILGGDNVKIILDEKISPATLTIERVTKFLKKTGGKALGQFVFNDYFEIKKLVNLEFEGGKNSTVDFTESHKLEKCIFKTGEITGWNRDLTALKKLKIFGTSFDPKLLPTSLTHLEVDFYREQTYRSVDLSQFPQLEILVIAGAGAVGWNWEQSTTLKDLTIWAGVEGCDLSQLPKSLERLVLYDYPFEHTLECPPSTSLPNVKQLTCTLMGELAVYYYCPSLTALTVGCCKLITNLIPKSVEKINFEGPAEIDGSLPYGTLMMVTLKDFFDGPFEWDLVDDILEKLNPMMMAVYEPFQKSTQEIVSENILRRIQESIEKQKKRPGGVFFLGKLQWINSDELSEEQLKIIFKDSDLPMDLMFRRFVFSKAISNSFMPLDFDEKDQ